MSLPSKIIRFCFYLLVILVPLVFLPNTSELFEFNKMITTYILTTIIAGTWMADMILHKQFIFKKSLLDLPIIIFLISQFISLVFSIDVRTSMLGYYSRFNGGLASLACYSLLYWAYVTYMDRKSTLSTLYLALSTAALVSLYGCLEHFGIDAHLWVQDVQNRVFSTLGQPNWLAAYIVALIWIPISMLLKFQIPNLNNQINSNNQKFNKFEFKNYFFIGYWLLSIMLFLTLLYTKSRSGFLAFGITAVVYWGILLFKNITPFPLLSAKTRANSEKLRGGIKESVILPFLGYWLLVITLTLTISNPIRDIFLKSQISNLKSSQGTSLEVGGTESTAIRKIVWTGAVRIWLSSAKNFFIGTGPETFAMAYYQYRPIEHNNTSEWELLYNKAHNEFLNYLATTGILGLGTYLILLITMFIIFIKNYQLSVIRYQSNQKINQFQNLLSNDNCQLITLALCAGWLTIPITNFWGFSVVIVQILMFLLPAMAITLNISQNQTFISQKKLSSGQIFGLLLSLFAICYLLFAIYRYWLADVKYASGRNQIQAFAQTQEPVYLLGAYNHLISAYSLNKSDPPIVSDLGLVTAYLSLLSYLQDATTSSQLAVSAINMAQKAIDISPRHPNYYKNLSRVANLAGINFPKYYQISADALTQALLISPTDPRIPYNLGLVAEYTNELSQAKIYYNQALKLKPDFADPQSKLDQLATISANPL